MGRYKKFKQFAHLPLTIHWSLENNNKYMKKRKRTYYEVSADYETEIYRFYKYERMVNFIWQFIPRWDLKLHILKIKPNQCPIIGRIVRNARWPVRF